MASSTSGTSSAKAGSSRKAPAKKSSSGRTSQDRESNGGRSAPKAASRPPARAGQVAAQAASELLELTGKGAEGVVGLERTEDGWTVQVEVVEVRRIPDTTDVLALYEIETDQHGALQGYRRVRRYTRGSAGNES
jgi:Gas vesicle synthesis protein GvpO